MRARQAVIVGNGETAVAVADSLLRCGDSVHVVGYAAEDKTPGLSEHYGLNHLGADLRVFHEQSGSAELVCVMALDGTPESRARFVEEAPEVVWWTVVDPTAVIAAHVSLGRGSIIMPRTVIQPGAEIREFAVIGASSVIETNAGVGDYSEVSSSTVIGARARIGSQVCIGPGVRVREDCSVGDRCNVGAGSVVLGDIQSGQSVAGIPATTVENTPLLQISEVCVHPKSSIGDAMAQMAKTAITISLVTDQETRRLLGIMTDGDIRRALLSGCRMTDPVESIMNREFEYVRDSVSRRTVIDLMQADRVEHMPVLDEDGRVVGLQLSSGLLGAKSLPITVIIMAGGRGTRLRPVTESIPKPMVRVAGRPILEHIVTHLVGCNIRQVHIALNYLAEAIEDYFRDGAGMGCHITYLREKTPLGTGGALKLLPPDQLDGRLVLALNGDLITQVDVEQMLNTHFTDGNTVTVGVRPHEVNIPYGVVETNGRQMVCLREKPSEQYLVNAGIYLFDPSIFSRIPAEREFPITDLLESCIEHGEKVGVYIVDGDWIDVGQHEQLARARGLH